MATGDGSACLVDVEGAVWCWGDAEVGQLGEAAEGDHSEHAIEVPGLTETAQLAAGKRHVCARGADERVSCWGSNSDSALARDSLASSTTPLEVFGDAEGTQRLETAIDIAAGDDFSCVAVRDGSVWCWGRNDSAQLGVAASDPSSVPVQVGVGGSPLLEVVDVEAGESFACAIYGSEGGVACWGDNSESQLGASQASDTSAIVSMGGGGPLLGATLLALGNEFACAATASGANLLLGGQHCRSARRHRRCGVSPGHRDSRWRRRLFE